MEGEEEREKDGVASGDGREVRGYIYGILMADKEIKAKGFCEAFFFVSLIGFGKMREREREREE